MSTNQLHIQMNMPADEEFARELETVESTVIKPIVRRKLHVTLFQNDTGKRNQDALELVGDIRLSLLTEIRKAGTSNGGIRSISAYAATVTFNACYQHFRSRFPQRTRLRNKLRYLLTHDDGFALWRDSFDRLLCGLAAWTGRDQHVQAPSGTDADLTLIGNERETSAAVLQGYFTECQGPVFFDDLVARVAEELGLIEPTESSDDLDGVPNLLCDPRRRIDAVLELTSRLKSLWNAILELPVAHRKALLLNLRDGSGDNLLAALPLNGVASIRQIAAAVEMTFEETACIWNSLPWDDKRIAEHLGLTRQQVINLRQTARAKLTRWRNDGGNI